MPERARDEKLIFLAALEQATAQQREAYIQDACAGDLELLKRAKELLSVHEQSQGPLDSPPTGFGSSPTIDLPITEKPGTVIGPYKLLQQIGEGGMGTVFMAEQTQPVQRKVALKVIKPGMDSRQVIARFEAERQALAMMDHVNIARVLDAGTTGESSGSRQTSDPAGTLASSATGRPYFVMELVHGVPITKYCDDNHLTPRERLELFVPVCQAIQHAHQKGIIHRDVKPSNVMITLYDGKPVPKVIDFGVAKATEQKLTERTLFTQYGTMVGTLEYMSPEQAEMSALGVDTRSDIYSLGVLLYELLTGSTPLDHKRVREAAYGEILRMIKEEEPPKPSTRLSDSGEALASISAQRHTEPAKLAKLLRGELDWIVMKTLEKDRNRRYETVNGFAADVQHYLNDEPVEACPPSAGYRIKKFYRRNRRLVLAGAAVFAALLAGMAGTTAGLLRARQAERLAYAEAEVAKTARAEEAEQRTLAYRRSAEAEAARKSEAEQREAADRERDKAVTERQRAESLAAETRQRLVRSHVAQGVRLMENGDLLASLPWFVQALKLDEDDPARERVHRLRIAAVLEQCPKLVQAWFPEKELGAVRFADFSPDSRRFAATGASFTLAELALARAGGPQANFESGVWDLLTGRPVTPPLKHSSYVYEVSFSLDGRRLAVAGADGTVQIFAIPTGEPVTAPLKHGRQARHARFSPDGKRLATAAGDGARLWNAETGELIAVLAKGDSHDVAFSPDGRSVVTAAWHHAEGQPITPAELQQSRMGTVRVWDAVTGEPISPAIQHAEVYRTAFSPDGRSILTAGFDRTARVWNATTGEPVSPVLKHGNSVFDASFSPDGRRVVTAGTDRLVWLWDANTGELTGPPLQHTDSVLEAWFAADGRRLLTSEGRVIRVWDATTGKLAMSPIWVSMVAEHVRFSPDGRFVLTTGDAARVWDTDRIAPNIRVLATDQAPLHAAFSPDGRRIVTAPRWKGKALAQVRVMDVETGKTLVDRIQHRGNVNFACFSPDGRWVLTASSDKTARVWDSTTGQPVSAAMEHSIDVRHASFSPDGRRVVTAIGSDYVMITRNPDGTETRSDTQGYARVWDAATGKPVTEPLRHSAMVVWTCFSPDGTRVVTAAGNSGQNDFQGEARIWNSETGEEAGPPLKHLGMVRRAAFSRDGRRVATAGDDGVRIWNAASGEAITEIVQSILFTSGVTDAAFSPDGRRLVTATGRTIGAPGEARVWDVETGQPLTPPMVHPEGIQDVDFSPDGLLIVTGTGQGSPGNDTGEVRLWDATTGEPVTPPLKQPGAAFVATFSPDGRRVLSASRGWKWDDDGQVQLWDLALASHPVDDLVEISTLLSGRRIDPTGAFVPAELPALRRAWVNLRVKYPDLFAISRE